MTSISTESQTRIIAEISGLQALLQIILSKPSFLQAIEGDFARNLLASLEQSRHALEQVFAPAPLATISVPAVADLASVVEAAVEAAAEPRVEAVAEPEPEPVAETVTAAAAVVTEPEAAAPVVTEPEAAAPLVTEPETESSDDELNVEVVADSAAVEAAAEEAEAAAPEPEAEQAADQASNALAIQKVADHVSSRLVDIQDLEVTVTSRAASQDGSDSEGSASEAAVDPSAQALEIELQGLKALHKRALLYSEELLRDLLTLDAITGLAERPLQREARKEQVNRIQELLSGVDDTKGRIAEAIKEVSTKLETARTEATAAAAATTVAVDATEAARASTTPVIPTVAAPAPAPVAAPDAATTPRGPTIDAARRARLEAGWRKQRLNVDFKVVNAPAASVIAAAIPGLSLDNIKLSLSDEGGSLPSSRVLQIHGERMPTDAEYDELLRVFIEQRPAILRRFGTPSPSQREEFVDAVLLRLGEDSFGAIDASYRVPASVGEADIKATYRDGVLRITVPREEPQPRQRRAPYQHPLGMFGGGGYNGGYGGGYASQDRRGGLFW